MTDSKFTKNGKPVRQGFVSDFMK